VFFDEVYDHLDGLVGGEGNRFLTFEHLGTFFWTMADF
jgi:hypothetical protein